MVFDSKNTATLLENWEHFDPEGTRIQKILRSFCDQPHNETLRQDAQRLLRTLPIMVQQRLHQLASAAH